MSEHAIRLRGGWEWRGEAGSGRVALPMQPDMMLPLPIELIRRFQAPDCPDGETVWLRLDRVRGLTGIHLNGVCLSYKPDQQGAILFPLNALRPGGNELVLAVGPGDWVRSAERWGEVALVIQG